MGRDPLLYLGNVKYYRWFFTLSAMWKEMGWGAIIYLAAIAGIDPTLYESAQIDGAGRLKRIWHITLPSIASTIVVLLIMNLGNILGGGFDRPFALSNNLVLRSAEVIATYVYKTGIKGLQFSLTTAVGLFQSLVGLLLVLASDWFSKRLGEDGLL